MREMVLDLLMVVVVVLLLLLVNWLQYEYETIHIKPPHFQGRHPPWRDARCAMRRAGPAHLVCGTGPPRRIAPRRPAASDGLGDLAKRTALALVANVLDPRSYKMRANVFYCTVTLE
jgi:hypothetical protein